MTDAAPPLALYVHWPYCARICPYCDFNVALRRKPDEPAALASAILADLAVQASGVGRRRLVSIFFGGGTPSLMEPVWVADVVARARAAFEAAPDLEVTLEANPTDAEAGRFAALAEAGVNRLSLGVQSLDDEALRFLGRNHDAAEARRAAAVARRAFPRLSVDLIYALPGQSAAAWRRELNEALAELAPEHVSAYQLTIEPGTPFERAARRGRWATPDSDVARALYETTGEVLGGAGFDAYEVSNHARGEGARSRHNLVYWRGADWLGVGPGAHGRITGPDRTRWATRATARIGDYLARVRDAGCGVEQREPLSAREAALERLLMGLRTTEGVRRAELAALDIAPGAVERLSAAGLMRATPERLVATAEGRLVLDRLTLELAEAARAR